MKLFTKKLLIFSILTTYAVEMCASQVMRKPRIKQLEVKTVQKALGLVNEAINKFPYLKNAEIVQVYEKEQSDVLVACAKVLYDITRNQLLDALSEIDARLAYWQYQKDHPWSYFVSKSPLKWVTGPTQNDEIENNLELLKSHQGELYVLLGQLSAQETVFNQGYKDLFLTDYMQAYKWIDALLDTVVRIKIKALGQVTESPFIARAQLLQAKLKAVDRFKDDILSEIPETAIPSYVERNWLKGGAVLFGLGYGYANFYDQITSSVTAAQQGVKQSVIEPVYETVQDVFYAGKGRGVSVDVLSKTRDAELKLTESFVRDKGGKYKLSDKEQAEIINDLQHENYQKYQNFLDMILRRESVKMSEWKIKKFYQDVKSGVAQLLDASDYVQGKIHFYELFSFNLIAAQQRQYAAVGKLVLLIPAALTAAAIYAGYQKLAEKNYGPLRRALVDVNSLFVDPSKQLTDEQQGKMIYLIYVLKKRAEKELPLKKNVQADFIHDLERIESQEFNVAAKRAIVEDMFKKYSFLGLVQKK